MGIEAINDHVSLCLPENYVFQRGTGAEGDRFGSVLFVRPGEKKPEITLKIGMKDGELGEEERNWRGTHHLTLIVKTTELPFGPFQIKALVVAACSERNKNGISLLAAQMFRDQEGLRAAAQLAAGHLSALLPNVVIDGVSGPVDPLSGEDLLRIGGLLPTMSEEEAKKKDLEFMAGQIAKSDNPELLMKLSMQYYTGEELDKDEKKAAELMEKAARLGHPIAQFNTAIKYARGEGVLRDFAKAVAWMEKARDNGDTDAPKHILAMKDGTALERRAGEGDAQAQARFAALLAQYPSKANAEEARKMAESAVNSGCAEGYRTLGQIYEQGLETQKDLKKAAEAYENGAKRGDAACQSSLGRFLLQGFGVKKNVEESIPWLLNAADQGDLLAAVNLSVLTSKGVQPCTTEKLIEYLLKAEKLDPFDARAADHLAIQYLNLPQPDYDNALQWYERAAELGSENGKEMANLFRYRRKLIDRGELSEDCGPDAMFRYLQKHDLVDEAFGRTTSHDKGVSSGSFESEAEGKTFAIEREKEMVSISCEPELRQEIYDWIIKETEKVAEKPGRDTWLGVGAGTGYLDPTIVESGLSVECGGDDADFICYRHFSGSPDQWILDFFKRLKQRFPVIGLSGSLCIPDKHSTDYHRVNSLPNDTNVEYTDMYHCIVCGELTDKPFIRDTKGYGKCICSPECLAECDDDEGLFDGEDRLFAITGKLKLFQNRVEFAEYIEELGGNVSDSVSPETDFLICNDEASTSSKMKKAKELGIPVITEEDFIWLFGNPDDFGLSGDEDDD